jgi:hypothetical protein
MKFLFAILIAVAVSFLPERAATVILFSAIMGFCQAIALFKYPAFRQTAKMLGIHLK